VRLQTRIGVTLVVERRHLDLPAVMIFHLGSEPGNHLPAAAPADRTERALDEALFAVPQDRTIVDIAVNGDHPFPATEEFENPIRASLDPACVIRRDPVPLIPFRVCFCASPDRVERVEAGQTDQR